MEKIIIEETEDTPKIELDKSNDIFEITGRSLPENAPGFYEPVQKWLTEYIQDPNPFTEFLFKLEYFNSASAKQLLEILIKLEQIAETGKDVKVVWYFIKEDDLMESRGEELKSMVDIRFELKAY
ncbi:MAG: DUF1987 domain-containing protein [Bacteroidetes bacterium]|nr:DUF1987 domain-containing protein [Bacteroidota bacterium]